jgi:hypothetical protein
MGWERIGWIQLAQSKDQWMAVANTEPSGSIRGREFFE